MLIKRLSKQCKINNRLKKRRWQLHVLMLKKLKPYIQWVSRNCLFLLILNECFRLYLLASLCLGINTVWILNCSNSSFITDFTVLVISQMLNKRNPKKLHLFLQFKQQLCFLQMLHPDVPAQVWIRLRQFTMIHTCLHTSSEWTLTGTKFTQLAQKINLEVTQKCHLYAQTTPLPRLQR